MNKIVVITISLLVSLSISLSVSAAEKSAFRVECIPAKSEIYANEMDTFTITLISDTPDIAYADVIKLPELNHGEASSITKIGGIGQGYVKEINGNKYFHYPIYSFTATISEKGKYELKNGVCKVGIKTPVIIDDPFWGRRRSYQTKEYSVDIEKTSIKVKPLPELNKNIPFSNVIGNFKIETIVPTGAIIVGREALAYIILKGEGELTEDVMPDYQSAFSDGLKLKSVSDSRNKYISNGKLISELTLECTFVPEVMDSLQIGVVKFHYFNPESGKYETVSTQPVKLNISSSVVNRKKLNI